ncbi:MAG: ferrous iron transport protein B [Candidatus Coatesbacteria bacterium]|nr:MAG: ferrous iron transport protein B [Candidatus Coatesbacteria bacterium]
MVAHSPITVALAGNPNAGKTSLFNGLTGGRQRVGNWPGVTVERKEGTYRYGAETFNVVDLPGTYSLGAYSLDEVIARDFLLAEEAEVVVNVVDASNLERNLYLTTQLLEIGAPLVVALNMFDRAQRTYDVDPAKLSELLGVPVVPTVGTSGWGLENLRAAIAAVARDPRRARPLELRYGSEIEPHLAELAGDLANLRGFAPALRPRWTALKLLEGDDNVQVAVREIPGGGALVEEAMAVSDHLGRVIGEEAEVAVADYRYGFIRGLLRDVLRLRGPSPVRLTASDRIDRVVTHRLLGIPLFLAVAYGLFELTFTVAEPIVGFFEAGLQALGSRVAAGVEPLSPLLASFLVDGVLGGVGSVAVFVPNIFLLFLVLAFLEDSGYMARVAYVMDEFMHRLSLHGRSFIPLILGFGCNVPAIMATRTLDSRRERMITLLVIPWMSCSARLPIYVLFGAAFFPGRRGLVVWSLYLLGIVLAVGAAKVFSRVLFPGESAHFVMELPPYRLPTLRGAFLHAGERSWEFLKRAGGIILAASVLLWGLANLPPGVAYAGRDSFLGTAGAALAPLFAPAGFADWRPAVALLAGIGAKEAVVSTLGVLYGVGGEGLASALRTTFSPLAAYAYMVMTLLYIPCVATIAVIRRETGSWRWTLFAVAYTLIVGWAAAVLVYQGGRLLGWG